MVPASSEGFAASELGELLHPRLELRSEVSDKALDGPGEGLSKSYLRGLVTVVGLGKRKEKETKQKRNESTIGHEKLTANGVTLNLLR